MKARIIETPARVYQQADPNSFTLTELPCDTEVELGAVKKKDGKSWVAVTYGPNQQGFIAGDTRIYRIKQAVLVQASANVYTAPSAIATVKAQYKKNTQFLLLGTVAQDGKNWVKIRDLAGNEGFIDGTAKIKVIAEKARPTKALGKKNMLYGALWCIGGIVLTVVTYSAATSSGGGTYFVFWGAVIFGGIQFVQGLIQFLTAPE